MIVFVVEGIVLQYTFSDGWTLRSDNNAISAFNYVEVEVEAELGNY